MFEGVLRSINGFTTSTMPTYQIQKRSAEHADAVPATPTKPHCDDRPRGGGAMAQHAGVFVGGQTRLQAVRSAADRFRARIVDSTTKFLRDSDSAARGVDVTDETSSGAVIQNAEGAISVHGRVARAPRHETLAIRMEAHNANRRCRRVLAGTRR